MTTSKDKNSMKFGRISEPRVDIAGKTEISKEYFHEMRASIKVRPIPVRRLRFSIRPLNEPFTIRSSDSTRCGSALQKAKSSSKAA